MKKTIVAIVTLVLAFITSIGVCAEIIPVWNKDGWVITAKFTNPAKPVGKVADVTATVTYMIDGVLQTVTSSDTFALNMAATKTKKIWTSGNVLNTLLTITEITSGDAYFDASGKLVFSVEAPNDGAEHTVSFKLKPITAILSKNSVLKRMMASILKFN